MPMPQPQPFGLIEVSAPQRRRRRWALGASTLVQVALAAGLAHWVRDTPWVLPAPTQPVTVTLLVPPPPRITPRLPPPPKIPAPRPVVHRLAAAPIPPPPHPRRVVVRMAATPLAVPILTPLPNLPHFKAPPAPPRPVKLNSFVQTASVSPHPERRQLRAAGFGDPSTGLTARVVRGNVSAAGFNLPVGSPGAARTGAIASAGFGTAAAMGASPRPGGSVASAGFGTASIRASSSTGSGRVQASGFGTRPVAAPPSALRPAAPELTPVEILAKPDPDYTAEARRLHIEGEVVLRVVFGADGRLRVAAVVQGLGHGLDQAAVAAAERIRFHPARRNGAPVETSALIHVLFQLADE